MWKHKIGRVDDSLCRHRGGEQETVFSSVRNGMRSGKIPRLRKKEWRGYGVAEMIYITAIGEVYRG